MRAAICDNDKIFLTHLDTMLQGFNCISEILSFSDFDVLKAEILSGRNFDVVFMDCDWRSEENGLDLTELLYDHCPQARVVYVTSYPIEYAQRMFLRRSNTVGFLAKPVDHSLLEQVLDSLLSPVRQEQGEYFELRKSGSVLRFPAEQVLYLESSDHVSYVHLVSGESVQTAVKLTDAEKLLPAGFVRCHRSYIVNLRHLFSYNRNEVILLDSIHIPVGRSRYEALDEAYLRYAGKCM